jgi:glycosyltransferase involved in cell wall biosynthesis
MGRLNMFGFFGGQFGLGESARLYASALKVAGVPVATIDLDLGLPHARQRVSEGARPNPGSGAIDLIIVNPDHFEDALPVIESLGPEPRFRVGCWYWELGDVPQAWREAISKVDALMVSSSFVERAFTAVTDKPVFRVPLPLVQRRDSGLGRSAFGLSNTAFVYLTSFDFHSSVYRKNPQGVIAAFAKAFPTGEEDVQLVVKSSNGEYYPAQLAELIEAAGGDRRVLIRNQVIDACHMQALQRCCDAFVSMHRAEGFGLGLAECMAMGKPVIATAWSGNLDFMTHENSCLVEAVLVPVQPHEYPYAEEGACWAEPDMEQAAAWMRRLVSEPDLAAQIGGKAARQIREKLSPEQVAEELLIRVQQVCSVAATIQKPEQHP